jgi:hypothetical protein
MFREAGLYPLQHYCLHILLAFLDSVLALDDGEYANEIAMLDCIMDAGSIGSNNWFSKLSEPLKHVHGGMLLVDDCMQMGLCVNIVKYLTLWRKHQHTTVWGNMSADSTHNT